MLNQDTINLPTDIPPHLMMMMVSYNLLLGNDIKVIGIRETDDDRILIHFKKDGKSDYCYRPLNKKQLSLAKTQKIPLPFGPLPREIKNNISTSITDYALNQSQKADALTTREGRKIYYLKDSFSLPAQKNIIDIEETKVQNNTPKKDLTKPLDLQDAPDEIKTVYFQQYCQHYEKHIIEM